MGTKARTQHMEDAEELLQNPLDVAELYGMVALLFWDLQDLELENEEL